MTSGAQRRRILPARSSEARSAIALVRRSQKRSGSPETSASQPHSEMTRTMNGG
jgi:hypothetical protein